MVVVTELEAHLSLASDHEPAGDLAPAVRPILVRERFLLPEFAIAHAKHGDRPLRRPATGRPHRTRVRCARRVRTGCDLEVVLEFTLVAVVDGIDTGVDASRSDPPVGRHVVLPLRRVAATVVVHGAAQRGFAGHGCRRRSPDESGPNDSPAGVGGRRVTTGCRRQQDGRLRIGEQDGVARASRQEPDTGGRLPLVALEVQGGRRQFCMTTRRDRSEPAGDAASSRAGWRRPLEGGHFTWRGGDPGPRRSSRGQPDDRPGDKKTARTNDQPLPDMLSFAHHASRTELSARP